MTSVHNSTKAFPVWMALAPPQNFSTATAALSNADNKFKADCKSAVNDLITKISIEMAAVLDMDVLIDCSFLGLCLLHSTQTVILNDLSDVRDKLRDALAPLDDSIVYSNEKIYDGGSIHDLESVRDKLNKALKDTNGILDELTKFYDKNKTRFSKKDNAAYSDLKDQIGSIIVNERNAIDMLDRVLNKK